jgi:hypothetical protein
VKAMRVGGGYASPDYYYWGRWRGEPSERPSDGAKWGSCLLSGFGPFEAIDLCEALGIEPVCTARKARLAVFLSFASSCAIYLQAMFC